MAGTTFGGCLMLFMATLAFCMGGIFEAGQLLVSHVFIMAGGTFSFLACNVGSRGPVGVMAVSTFATILMGLVREMRGFLAGVAQGHLGRSVVGSHTDAGNGAGESKGKSSGTDNHLFHLFPLTK